MVFLQPFGCLLQRGVFKKCDLSGHEYSLLNPEHECKRCHRSVCQKCLKKVEVNLWNKGNQIKKHKVCLVCLKEIAFIQQLVNEYQLYFSTNSTIAYLWKSRVAQTQGYVQQYHQHLKQAFTPEITKFFNKKVEIFQEFWPSLNFSLFDLINKSRNQNSFSMVEESISNVVIAVLNKTKNTFKARILHLVSFLLCFLNEQLCFKTVCSMIALMQKQKQRLRQQSLKVRIREDISNFMKLQKKVHNQIGQIIQNYGDDLVTKFTVNTFSTQICLFIVHQTLMAQNYFEARSGIGAALIDKVYRLVGLDGKKLKSMTLVRSQVKDFYELYSRMVGRKYSNFIVNKKIDIRLERARSGIGHPILAPNLQKERIRCSAIEPEIQRLQKKADESFRLRLDSFVNEKKQNIEISMEQWQQIDQSKRDMSSDEGTVKMDNREQQCNRLQQQLYKKNSLIKELQRQVLQLQLTVKGLKSGQSNYHISNQSPRFQELIETKSQLSSIKFENMVLKQENNKIKQENRFYLMKITQLSKHLMEYTGYQIL